MVFPIRYMGHMFKRELCWFTLDAAVLFIHPQGRASVVDDIEELATVLSHPSPGGAGS